jgi:hypothetical protein
MPVHIFGKIAASVENHSAAIGVKGKPGIVSSPVQPESVTKFSSVN